MGCTDATPETADCADALPAAALTTLTAVDEFPTAPQAASSPIAVSPTPQRDRCKAKTLVLQRTRSQ